MNELSINYGNQTLEEEDYGDKESTLLGKRFYVLDSDSPPVLEEQNLSVPSELPRNITKKKKKKKILIPFWNEYSKTVLQKWDIPNTIDYTNIHVNEWIIFSDISSQKSWFDLEIKKSSQTRPKLQQKLNSSLGVNTSFQCLWRSILDKDDNDLKEISIVKKVKISKKSKSYKEKEEKEEKPPPQKCRKVRIYPNKDEVQTLRKFLGAVRKTYNLCLDAINKKECRAKKQELRDRYVNSEILKTNNELSWLLEVPYDIRNHGLEDLLNNIKSNLAKKKKNPDHKFKLKFRSKKDYQQSFVIPSKHWNTNGVYSFLRKIKSSEKIVSINYDSRLLYDIYGHYYICIPLPLTVKSENQAPLYERSEGVIALDPGLRKFMTTFDSCGLVTQWGVNDIKRIERLYWYYDDLQSRWNSTEIKHRKRYNLRKAGKRIQYKIKNLVNELHKKLTNWLCENYRVILLPKFETAQMVKRHQNENRSLNSKTARNILTLSHYRFQQRLISKAREYPWCNVIIVDEEYTSKTCSGCGLINRKLGGSEVFKCSDKTCNRIIDRDINGAMNILIRYLTIHKI